MYKDLSLKEKAKVLQYGGKLGLTSVEDIAKLYDDAVSHKFAEGSMATPDWDPDNPYHYHTANGEKVVITPEDWERHKGQPYFKQVEDAVLAEQAAHPGPEYIINPKFSEDLRRIYKGNMGPKYQNYSSFSGNLPQGYSFTPEGLVQDNQGNLYVQKGFRQSPRFTYDELNPLTFPVLEGRNKGNVTFYPVNMEKAIKSALPINRTIDVEKERNKAIEKYIKNNTIHSTKDEVLYKAPYFYPDIDAIDYDWEEWKKEHPIQASRETVTKDYLYDLIKQNAINHFIFADEEGLEYDPFWSEDEDWVNDSYMQEKFDKQFNSYISKPINQVKEKSNITKKPTYAKAKQKAVIEVGPLQVDGVWTYAQGGPIISPYGQWKYPGRDTIIPSNDITMDNVNYPVLGISDAGDAKVMMPWNDYKFRGSMVYEHPLVGHLAQDGKHLSKRKNEFVNRIESMQDKPDFMKRFHETPFLTIPDWVNANDVASHKMSWATDDKGNAIVYPNVQRVDGRLIDFTRPPYSFWAGYDSALRRGDTLMTTPGIADWWTRNYKEYYPEIREFNNNLYQLGGLAKPFSYNPIPPVRYQKGGNLSSYMNDSQLENARGIWNYLVGQKGLTQRNAAAMMGNVMQESGLNPNAKNPKSSAKGYFQMLDSKRKDYDKWLRNNPHSKDYGEFDYYVHLIDDVVDPYMDGYNSFMKRWDDVKKAYEAKPSDRNRQSMQEYQDYYDRMYRQRVEDNRLFPVIDFNRAWNNYELPLNEITPLFEETFERAGEGSEHEKRNNCAQDFYDYFYDPDINRQEIFNWENNRHMQKRISPVPADFRLPNRPLAQSAQLPTDIYLNEMMLDMPSYNQLMYHEKPQGYFFSNGGIHIKPENRGKFTRLKKRTGHSASWFKAHGTPAQRKMATFALNSRHWKHDDGGHLFQGVGNSRITFQNGQPYLINNIGTFLPEINVVDDKPLPENPRNTRGFTESNGTYYLNGIPTGEVPLQKDALTGLVEFGPTFIAAGGLGLVGNALKTELGKQILASEIGGKSVDLASNLFTGNTWGQNVGNVVEGITGWNPNNSVPGQLLTTAFNPGYYISPSSLINGMTNVTNGVRNVSLKDYVVPFGFRHVANDGQVTNQLKNFRSNYLTRSTINKVLRNNPNLKSEHRENLIEAAKNMVYTKPVDGKHRMYMTFNGETPRMTPDGIFQYNMEIPRYDRWSNLHEIGHFVDDATGLPSSNLQRIPGYRYSAFDESTGTPMEQFADIFANKYSRGRLPYDIQTHEVGQPWSLQNRIGITKNYIFDDDFQNIIGKTDGQILKNPVKIKVGLEPQVIGNNKKIVHTLDEDDVNYSIRGLVGDLLEPTQSFKDMIRGERMYKAMTKGKDLPYFVKGIDYERIPIRDETKTVFEKYVMPRLKANHPEINESNILQKLYNQPNYLVREELFPQVTHTKDALAISNSNENIHLAFQDKLTKSLQHRNIYTDSHELRHTLQRIVGPNKEEQKILKKAYGSSNIKPTEYETMNLDARTALFQRNKLRRKDGTFFDFDNIDLEIQNKIIQNYPDKKFVETVYDSDGYWRRYIDDIIDKSGIDGPFEYIIDELLKTPEFKQTIQNWKNAMMKVGAVSGVAAGVSNNKNKK